jgi:hypothetical protein
MFGCFVRMALSGLGVICSLLMLTLLYLFGSATMMFSCFFVMLGCIFMMFLWHNLFYLIVYNQFLFHRCISPVPHKR